MLRGRREANPIDSLMQLRKRLDRLHHKVGTNRPSVSRSLRRLGTMFGSAGGSIDESPATSAVRCPRISLSERHSGQAVHLRRPGAATRRAQWQTHVKDSTAISNTSCSRSSQNAEDPKRHQKATELCRIKGKRDCLGEKIDYSPEERSAEQCEDDGRGDNHVTFLDELIPCFPPDRPLITHGNSVLELVAPSGYAAGPCDGPFNTRFGSQRER